MNRHAITAYDDQGQPVATYPNLTSAASAHGALPQHIRRALRNDWRCAGLRWRQHGEEAPAPIPAKPQVLPERQYVVVAGGRRATYATLEAVGAALGVTRQAVQLGMRRGRPVAGARVEVKVTGVVAYDDAGAAVGTFPNALQAAKALGDSDGSVRYAAAHGTRTRAGLRYRAEGEPNPGPWQG